MATNLYDFEHEFVFTDAYDETVVTSYTVDQAIIDAVKAKFNMVQTILKYQKAYITSIKVEASGHIFKVTVISSAYKLS